MVAQGKRSAALYYRKGERSAALYYRKGERSAALGSLSIHTAVEQQILHQSEQDRDRK